MNRPRSAAWIPPFAPFAAFALALAACGRETSSPSQDPEPPRAPTNRIEVPESVRRNLGITFVKVERRRVAATLRAPGRFELRPSAHREHRVPLAGRVEPAAEPLQVVKAGDVLYRLDAPEWRAVQKELGELSATVTVTRKRRAAMEPLLTAHREHEAVLATAVEVTAAHVASLEAVRRDVGGQAPELASARIQHAQARAALAEAVEKEAETQSTLLQLEADAAATDERLRLALAAASALAGVPLRDGDGPGTEPTAQDWRSIAALEVRSRGDGTVASVAAAHGAWLEVGALVLVTVSPRDLRFHAQGLQSDLARLRDGLPARVVAPQGAPEFVPEVTGTLALGVLADPEQRTVDLFVEPRETPPWLRPGYTALLEIELDASAAPELAVPVSAVLQDGLRRVLFRRDPKNPDEVIRIDADLGISDGRWVEVKSGLADGEEVVLGGAYELMLATSAAGASPGGHFHADGTFHPTDHK